MRLQAKCFDCFGQVLQKNEDWMLCRKRGRFFSCWTAVSWNAFCYRMPGSLPRKLGRTEFHVQDSRRQLGAGSIDQALHRRAKVPVREIPPVLAGIRASKSQNLAFPCDWRAQWLCQTPDAPFDKGRIYLPLRGQHTFSVSRLTLLHCNKAPRPLHSNLVRY